jgi:hypothetical protein
MNKKETIAINEVFMNTYERIHYFNSELAIDEMRGITAILEALGYTKEDRWQLENEVDKKHMKVMEYTAWESIEIILAKYKIQTKYDLSIVDDLKFNCNDEDMMYINRNIARIENIKAA